MAPAPDFDPLQHERGWLRSSAGLAVYPILGALLALTLPADVLSYGGWFATLVDAIANTIPAIRPLGEITRLPEVTISYLSVMWLLSPLAVLWVILSAPAVPDRPLTVAKWLFVMFVGIPLIALLAFALPLLYTGWSPADLTYSHGRGKAFVSLFATSRLGMCVTGGLFFFGIAIGGYCLIWAIPIALFRPILKIAGR